MNGINVHIETKWIKKVYVVYKKLTLIKHADRLKSKGWGIYYTNTNQNKVEVIALILDKADFSARKLSDIKRAGIT